jgi:hypothetical protein
VQEAQNAIEEAQRNRCVPISIGGGTGAGVGLGLCDNANPHAPCTERQEVGATYNVHVLVECPLDGPAPAVHRYCRALKAPLRLTVYSRARKLLTITTTFRPATDLGYPCTRAPPGCRRWR